VAETTHNARASAWKTSVETLEELNKKLQQCQPHERDALEQAIADEEEDLLETPAPSFSGVLTKLELMWSADLIGIHPETEQRRLILDDLAELIEETRELIGARA
jgi:hypothetical protein